MFLSFKVVRLFCLFEALREAFLFLSIVASNVITRSSGIRSDGYLGIMKSSSVRVLCWFPVIYKVVSLECELCVALILLMIAFEKLRIKMDY